MPKPIVALVGRPNVGKSTLFNRLVGERMAIVDETPGTTRDRLFGEAEWNSRIFHVIDTGGIDPTHGGKTPLSVGSADFIEDIRAQAQAAIDEADVVLFVNDGQTGVTGADLEVADILRRSQKKLPDGTFFPPILVVVNKCEARETRDAASQFYELGLGEPHPVSAVHGSDTGDLLDVIVASFPADGLQVTLIDTAGIRKRGKIERGVEQFSVLRSFKAIERADVALLMIDATTGITAQDAHIAGFILDQWKSCVVIVNKWDAIEKDSFTMEEYTRKIRSDLNFMDYVPLLFISAKTGQRVDAVLPMALRVQEERLARLTTSKINAVIHNAQDAHPHPTHAGRALKMFYGTQVRSDPPTFLIYVNDPKLMHFTYLRYLENQIREEYGFLGTPIRIVTKGRRE